MSDLSSQAQAVLDAANDAFDRAGTTSQGVAAALRAAADQVLAEATPLLRACAPASAAWSPFADQIRSELLAIADELEANHDPR